MQNKNTDSHLWSQIKKGNIEAYDQLYDLYSDVLFSFGMQYADDHAIVKDSIHDVFLDLYHYRLKLSNDVNVKSYLFKSLQRDIFKKLKSRKVIYRLDTIKEDYFKVDSAEDEIIRDEILLKKNKALAIALSSLTPKQRHALELRFSDDLSYEEISAVLGISLDSCRTLIYRSLKSVRKEL